jgi:hypothetical protein
MSAEELNARDMAIEEQLNFLSKQAAPKELANKPLKIKSEVTKDMVDDFRAEQEGSIFHPPSVLPVLETFHPVAVPEKERIDEDKRVLLTQIKDFEREIAKRVYDKERVKELYNEHMALLDLIRFDKKTTRLQMKDVEDERKESIQEFERLMEQFDREIAEFEIYKNRAVDKLNLLDKTLGLTNELIQQNEGEKARVERLNKEAIKTFESEINALNKGININQQVGESDEDYLTRIENMKGARYSQEVVVQAETFNVKRFKTKMKEIMSIPESALEIIIKKLQREELLYEANKKFPLIKTAIEKTYGLNPRFKADDEDDLHTFIVNTLTKQFSNDEEGLVVESQNADLLAKSKTGFIPKKDLLAIYESMTGKKSFTGSSKKLAEEIIKLRGLVIPAQEQAKIDVTARQQRQAQDFLSRIGRESKKAVELGSVPKVTATFGPRGEVLTETYKTPEEARLRYDPSGKDYVRQNLLTRMKEYEKGRQAGRAEFIETPTTAELKRQKKEQFDIRELEPVIPASKKRSQARIKGLVRAFQSSIPPAPTPEQEYKKVLEATLQAEAQPEKKKKGRPKKEVKQVPGQSKLPFAKGKGVEREFYPKLVPFGAIMISPAQLFYYKLLRVREPTKHSIRGMPDVRVSEDMVYILMKIINGGTPSMTELKALSENEKSLYDAVITKAKLHKELPNTSTQSIDKLKRRLELCEGEWNAGNDNTLIKKELNSIIRQLTELKAISEVDGRKYLKQF